MSQESRSTSAATRPATTARQRAGRGSRIGAGVIAALILS